MNVVVVGSVLPYPANSGGRLRTLHLLTRQARRHRVRFVAPRAATREAVAFLQGQGVEVVEVDFAAPPKSGLSFAARLAANLASPRPYAVDSHRSPALDRAVRAIDAEGGVDLWQAEWPGVMPSIARFGRRRTLLMTQNVETLIWERYADAERHPLKRLYLREQARKYARFERAVYRAAGRVVAVSTEDAGLMGRRFGADPERVDVVENGIDRAAFEGLDADAPRVPGRVLYLGSLDWRPNLDALGVLLDRIFPEVRARMPGATLDVVGRNPPAALARRILAEPGVTLHADVADVRPFLTRSAVLAVPLRVGGGSRLKILEALAAGLPVVSTRVGAEGLELEPGRHLDVADEPEAAAEALARVLCDPAPALARASEARAFVLRRYDWDALADALDAVWERCAAGDVRSTVPVAS